MLFKRLVLSDMLTIILSAGLTTYLYWYAYQMSLDQSLIALVGLGQLVGVLFASLGGGIADRFNKLTFIKIVTLFRFLLVLLLYLGMPHLPQTWLIVVFMLLSTICGNLLSPTMESLLPHLSQTDDQLYQLNAKLSSLTQLAGVLGIFLSALYVSFFSLELVLWTSLVLGVSSFLPLLGLRLSFPNQGQSVLGNIKKGLLYILETSYIRQLVPIALLMNLVFWTVFLLLPKLTSDYFAFLKPAYSLLELAFALGGILGGWYFSRRLASREHKYQLFTRGLFGQSLCLVGLGLSVFLPYPILSYLAVLLSWAMYAGVNTIVSILYFGSIQLKVPQEILGSVIGSLLTVFSLINPLAALLSPLLVQYLTLPVVIVLLGLLMLGLSVLVSNLFGLAKAFD